MKKNTLIALFSFVVMFVLVSGVSVFAEGIGKKQVKKMEQAVAKLEKLEDKLNNNDDAFDTDDVLEALSIGPKGKINIAGAKVTAVASSTISVAVWKLNFTVHNMPNTRVQARGRNTLSFERIKVGDVINVRGDMDSAQTAFVHAIFIRDRNEIGDQHNEAVDSLRKRIQEMIARLNALLGHTTPPPTPPPSTSDTFAPSMPTNVSASVISTSQINLSWSASTDNVGVTGYKVYRCTGAGCTPGDVVATVTGTSYQNTGLSASTTYIYAVTAYDAAGNMSTKTAGVSATTQVASTADTTAPSKPMHLSAGVASASNTQINIGWDASTDNVMVTGYKIYRCAGSSCTPTDQIDTTSNTSYQNTGLTASTTYMYSVAAYDVTGNVSEKSSTASAMTP